jgi:hypothetical protein
MREKQLRREPTSSLTRNNAHFIARITDDQLNSPTEFNGQRNESNIAAQFWFGKYIGEDWLVVHGRRGGGGRGVYRHLQKLVQKSGEQNPNQKGEEGSESSLPGSRGNWVLFSEWSPEIGPYCTFCLTHFAVFGSFCKTLSNVCVEMHLLQTPKTHFVHSKDFPTVFEVISGTLPRPV